MIKSQAKKMFRYAQHDKEIKISSTPPPAPHAILYDRNSPYARRNIPVTY
jgi:hypothetical protein